MKSKAIKSLLFLSIALALTACSDNSEVSFKSDIRPILDENCSTCHEKNGEGLEKSGMSLETYEGVMKGTKFGPVIEPGNAIGSSFYRLISGKVDKSIQMPHGKRALKPDEIETIKTWIDQGAQNN